MSADRLPVIDLAPLGGTAAEARTVASAIDRACRDSGFFYIVGHGIDPARLRRLEHLSREFFALDLEEKMAIRMALGGRAWRGYFPVGAELTSGRPDQKEGLYFGAELDDDHPAVVAATPLHGRNLFPARPADLREAVLDHMAAMTRLGGLVMEGMALALGLERTWFADRYTGDPFVLFRIFHYPPLGPEAVSTTSGPTSPSEHRTGDEPAPVRGRSAGDLASRGMVNTIPSASGPSPEPTAGRAGARRERYRSDPVRLSLTASALFRRRPSA
jgi:isopenicillin N synthase-like dioxygenase